MENKLHHANVITGKEDRQDFIFAILKNDLNFNTVANPDFLIIETESFGIDQARDLEKWAIGKPLLGEIKASFLKMKSITLEAQNALLKVLEEPPVGTYFFIHLENLGGLLPTFISRVRILDFYSTEKEETKNDQNQVSKFVQADVKKRLNIIREISKKENKIEMKEFIRDLEQIAYENFSKEMLTDFSKAKDIKKIMTAKIFASTRGSSPKMLLEWLSSVL